MQWMIDNKEWIFSGIGVAVIGYVLTLIIRSKLSHSQSIKGNDNIQAGRDVTVNPGPEVKQSYHGDNGNQIGVVHGDVNIGITHNEYKREVEKALEEASKQKQSDDETIKALRTALEKLSDEPASPLKEKAIKAAADGDFEAARQYYTIHGKEIADKGKAYLKEASEQFVLSGNIAYYSDTHAALYDYQKALEFDETNINAWNQLGHIQNRLGDLEQAQISYGKVIELAGGNQSLIAVGYGNLGLIYEIQGNLTKAEEYALKSLAIDEKLGIKEGMASQYGNLGIIYRTQGDLTKAEEYVLKSLAIDEKLGIKEGMASDYGNLGLIYQTQGDLTKAEEYTLKSLAIEEELGRKQGMAGGIAALGLIYEAQGDLTKAEEYTLKSLAIEEELGRKEGMASGIAALGLIYEAQGDLTKAEEYTLKSLAIEEELGRKEDIANGIATLGLIYEAQGDLTKAEEYALKALTLNEELGRKQGMANQYGNLGFIYQTQGDLTKAEECFLKCQDLFIQLGARLQIEQINGLLIQLSEDKEKDSVG